MNAPLDGKLLVVTRPEHQGASFIEKIRNYGGDAVHIPAIRLVPSEEFGDLVSLCRELERFDWVLFTSVNGVRTFLEALTEAGVPVSRLAERKIAAIGPATAKALRQAGADPDVIPDEYISDALPAALGEVRGASFLLPRADIARRELPVALRAAGATVREICAYRVVAEDRPSEIEKLKGWERKGLPDYLTFASASTVRGFHGLLKAADMTRWFQEIPIVSIGPITERAVRELGGRTSIVAKEYTTDGMLQAILEDQALRQQQEEQVRRLG